MTASAVDFSFARPSVAELKSAGIKAVGRYVTGRGKAASAVEVSTYVNAGIVTWFAFEDQANDASGGAPAGQRNAMQANAGLAAILGNGWAASQPRYFTVDENVAPSSVADYFVGICRVTGRGLVGAYGDGAVLDYLARLGLASYLWQSNSLSFPGNGATLPGASLRQLATPSSIPGTDSDQILAGDFGQFPRPFT